jgi:ribosomal protein S18 acetylase RimI-like enzyme
VATAVATRADVPSIAASLARAFADDPVMAYLFGGDETSRIPKLARWFTGALRIQHLHHQLTFTDDDRAAASLWDPPGHWQMTPGEIIRGGRWFLPAFGLGTVKALRALSAVERLHPTEPHYYLAVLGTDPSRQGKGLGSAVLQPVLERCDTEGLPAYLESSKESNIPFYRRHGFEVTGEIALPKGPIVWPMWREPKPR